MWMLGLLFIALGALKLLLFYGALRFCVAACLSLLATVFRLLTLS